ncbi:hypothetical protein BC941DRAFT_439000 [Chlamydoabsidia padenii]|nr:hypothetical protein BC941DRAFT_439000 [Chlamydoabsidia padenii]
MKNCCFCISLRTATLFLALLGTVTHFYSGLTLTTMSDAFQDFDRGTVFGLTIYSYLSGLACLAGAVGVFKNNVKKLRFFSIYYWTDLALHTGFAVASAAMLFTLHTDICKEIIQDDQVDLDMETCEAVYIQSAWIITVAMAINMLLKLHFAFAIHSYSNRVQQEQQFFNNNQDTVIIEYTPMPAIDEKQQPDNAIYVAGKEFIPDDKKQQA